MPFASNSGVRIYWRRDGKPSFPALVLGNSLGTDMSVWEPAMPAYCAISKSYVSTCVVMGRPTLQGPTI